MIGGTVFLYGVAHYLKGKKRYYFPVVLVVSGILFALILYVVSPQMYNLFISALFAFFGQQAITNTVQEARGWDLRPCMDDL